jgi:hypothetical protein
MAIPIFPPLYIASLDNASVDAIDLLVGYA